MMVNSTKNTKEDPLVKTCYCTKKSNRDLQLKIKLKYHFESLGVKKHPNLFPYFELFATGRSYFNVTFVYFT